MNTNLEVINVFYDDMVKNEISIGLEQFTKILNIKYGVKYTVSDVCKWLDLNGYIDYQQNGKYTQSYKADMLNLFNIVVIPYTENRPKYFEYFSAKGALFCLNRIILSQSVDNVTFAEFMGIFKKIFSNDITNVSALKMLADKRFLESMVYLKGEKFIYKNMPSIYSLKNRYIFVNLNGDLLFSKKGITEIINEFKKCICDIKKDAPTRELI